MFWEDVVKSVLNTKKPIKTHIKAKQQTKKVDKPYFRTRQNTDYSIEEDPDSIEIEMEDTSLFEDERQRPN